MGYKLDEIDKKLLRLLEVDAKISMEKLTKALHITKTPIYERIKRLEKEGIIEGYRVILNTQKITPSIAVYCFISLEAQKDAFQAEIQQYKEIVECNVVGGEFDFVLKVIVKDLEAYYSFAKNKLAAIPHVGQVKSAFVLNETKKTFQFPLLN